jgi:hypothetical protein
VCTPSRSHYGLNGLPSTSCSQLGGFPRPDSLGPKPFLAAVRQRTFWVESSQTGSRSALAFFGGTVPSLDSPLVVVSTHPVILDVMRCIASLFYFSARPV